MTSKERFNATCEFRKLDRPPIDYLAHAETDRKLRAHLGCESEVELLDRLGCDFFYLPARFARSRYAPPKTRSSTGNPSRR